jgi:hypothetical protein
MTASGVAARPSLGARPPHDWTRRAFVRAPSSAVAAEALGEPFVRQGTRLEAALSSLGGLDDALVVLRAAGGAANARRLRLWHGRRPLVEESFGGWFGPVTQRLSRQSVSTLVQRVPSLLVADASTKPTYILSLEDYAALGASHGALEAILDARVAVTADGLFARAAHVPSLRVYADYDGARYGAGARKLFYNARGDPVVVESVARDLLRRLGYDAVHPALFHRLHHALLGMPVAYFAAATWPASSAAARAGPLAAAAAALDRLEAARRRGFAATLADAFDAARRRPAQRRHPLPAHRLPLIGRCASRSRLDSLLASLGEPRLHAILRGLLLGYDCTAADWFAWGPGTGHAFLCEVKSAGDHLRESQKEAILWCQREGPIEYRLLEVLHQSPRENQGRSVRVGTNQSPQAANAAPTANTSAAA